MKKGLSSRETFYVPYKQSSYLFQNHPFIGLSMLFLMQIYVNHFYLFMHMQQNYNPMPLFLTCVNFTWRLIHEEVRRLITTSVYNNFLKDNGRVIWPYGEGM